MQTFSIGAVLGTTLQVWKRNFVPFTLISVGFYAPALLLRLEVAAQEWALYMVMLGTLLNTMIAAALTYGVVMELDGARPSFRDCVVIGLKQLPRVLWVVIVSGLAIVGGLLLLVVPGIIAMLMLYVAVPVAVLEKLPALPALQRSRELTNGRKGALFGIVLVTWIGSYGLDYIARDAFSGDVLAYVSVGTQAIFASFSAVLAAVIYTFLRREKNGTSVPEIAAAFARITSRAS